MKNLKSKFWQLMIEEEGATAAEYTIMASLIAGAIVFAVWGLGTATNGLFESFNSKMADKW